MTTDDKTSDLGFTGLDRYDGSDLESLLDSQLENIRSGISQGRVVVLERSLPINVVMQLRDYLSVVGRGSLPSWQPLVEGCPDFHRIQRDDPRSYVKGVMHQFAFHPWNQSIPDVFEIFRPHFSLRNRLADLPAFENLLNTPRDGVVARVSFQFYPAGAGYLRTHSDPANEHQVVAPIVQMSRKGHDYSEGGLVVRDQSGELIDIDSQLELGDTVLFDPQIGHGVLAIDPGATVPWNNFQGRWMALISIIKTTFNNQIGNAVEL